TTYPPSPNPASPLTIPLPVFEFPCIVSAPLLAGHPRLWQGDSVLEADAIELLREARVMNATGNVRAVFPQAAGHSTPQTIAVQAGPSKARLWHVTAGMLSYQDAERRAHLGKKQVAQKT